MEPETTPKNVLMNIIIAVVFIVPIALAALGLQRGGIAPSLKTILKHKKTDYSLVSASQEERRAIFGWSVKD
jgi:hypothetical protein